jgi:transcriptional regulator with XRE-family HTH domain
MRKAKPKQSTPVDQGIGNRIAVLRTAHGLSQSQLAEALGISFQQVQKYEAGKNRIGAGRLQAIADRLGVPVSTFFEDTSNHPPDDAIDLLLNSDGAIELLRAYASIADEEIRRSVLLMVKATLRVATASKSNAEETDGATVPVLPPTH